MHKAYLIEMLLNESPYSGPYDFDPMHVEIGDFYNSLQSEKPGLLCSEFLFGELNQLNDELQDGFGVKFNGAVEYLIDLLMVYLAE